MSNRRMLLGVGITLSLFATACDPDGLTDANNNPNDPVDAPSATLFTNSARLAAARWLDGVNGTRYGFLPQHMAQVQYPDDDQYLAARLGASATANLFNNSYNAELKDLDILIDRGKAASEPGLWAPAMVLSSWEFGVVTDVFGDVPFTEAFADAATLRPAYDPQQDVYDSIFVRLDEASDALASASNELGDGDPIYGGDPASWRRFANSLRLRHAMRLANNAGELSSGRVAAEVTAAAGDAGGLILTNAQNAELEWPGNGIYDHPWATNFKSRDDNRVSYRFIEIMRTLNDPRVTVLAMPAETPLAEIDSQTINYCPSSPTTCYVGLMNALTHDEASPLLPNTSRVGEIFYPGVTAYGVFGGTGGAYPSRFFTAAETEFLLAEAAQRGIGTVPGTAQSHYENGIRRHMEMLGIPSTTIDAYIAQPAVAYAGGTAGLIQIATQKWIALFTDPIQAWAEVRRTCQPAIVEPGPEARFEVLPRRLQYSTTEAAVNADERREAVVRQWGTAGGDVMTNRIYWDTDTFTAANPTYVAGCSDASQ
ncbi:MAG TPA: SusD/RagB family nutrient-binding outer membrane lipoprotein [Gemmatimonadaceae bacterium]|nr:SusD/RagB family nutrient-binding outer membrane lipoprotein [Gemmatimonadaceae bacterium]